MENNSCPICKTTEGFEFREIGASYSISCPRCGEYTIKRTISAAKCGLSERERANISGYLRENSGFKILSTNLENLRRLKTPSFHERTDKLLLEIEKRTTYAGEVIDEDISWISAAWCLNDEELKEMLDFLKTENRLRDATAFSWKIMPAGWAHLEEIKKVNADSEQGFVAMWFGDSMKDVFDEAIAPGILAAGYRPHRVDMREHNDEIDDEIIAQIRRSRFVLADFTGNRGGVYYEAGFAKGLGLEVVWTCKEGQELHFDIRQYNCIFWKQDDLDNFKNRITNRIESTIGRGTYRPDN